MAEKKRQTQRYRVSSDQRKRLASKAKSGQKRRKRRKKKKGSSLNWFLWLLLIFVTVMFFRLYSNRKRPYLAADDTLAVHFIDVGQGDCTLLACDGKIMLIDCGEYQYSKRVANYLSERGVTKIDYLVGTHPHSDHMGGMAYIVDNFDIGEVIVPHLADDDVPTAVFYERFLDSCWDKDCKVTEAQVGRVIELGDARAEVIAPASSGYEDLNDYSVSFFVTHGAKSFVLTGDAEGVSENEMFYGGKLSKADVYKAGHHGSSSSSTAAFLNIVRPDIVVISCGEGNAYGHPSKAAIDRISRYADKIYRTDLSGTVIIESDGKELWIMTERDQDDNT